MLTQRKFVDFSQDIASQFVSAFCTNSRSGVVILANRRFWPLFFQYLKSPEEPWYDTNLWTFVLIFDTLSRLAYGLCLSCKVMSYLLVCLLTWLIQPRHVSFCLCISVCINLDLLDRNAIIIWWQSGMVVPGAWNFPSETWKNCCFL